jgi:hypothetical protein
MRDRSEGWAAAQREKAYFNVMCLLNIVSLEAPLRWCRKNQLGRKKLVQCSESVLKVF